MRIRMITAGLAGLAACTASLAQGSFNFDNIPGVDEAPLVVVDINPTMVGFFKILLDAADPNPNPDPATPSLFEGLRGVKLRVYSATNGRDPFSAFIQDTALSLEGQGWQNVLAVQDEASSVRIHVRMTEEEVSGVTVMAMDGTEAIFINIDGTISAEALGQLMARYDLQGLIAAMPQMPPPANNSPQAPAPEGN